MPLIADESEKLAGELEEPAYIVAKPVAVKLRTLAERCRGKVLVKPTLHTVESPEMANLIGGQYSYWFGARRGRYKKTRKEALTALQAKLLDRLIRGG